jgi:hypothetical protein
MRGQALGKEDIITDSTVELARLAFHELKYQRGEGWALGSLCSYEYRVAYVGRAWLNIVM